MSNCFNLLEEETVASKNPKSLEINLTYRFSFLFSTISKSVNNVESVVFHALLYKMAEEDKTLRDRDWETEMKTCMLN